MPDRVLQMKSFSVKKIIFLIFIELFAACSFMGCTSKEHFDYQQYYESVFEIMCTSEGRFDSIGTGYKMRNYIITNAHLVTYKSDAEYFPYETIRAKSGANSSEYRLEIVSFDRQKDIAILCPSENADNFSDIPDLQETTNYQLGQEVFSIGNMNGYGLSLNVGIVSNNEKLLQSTDTEGRYIQTNIVIARGCSGSPVFDYTGKVIGMMTFKLRDANGEYIEGMSFSIPIEEVINYLESTI